MPATFSMTMDKFTPEFVEELRAKYGSAEVQITVKPMADSALLSEQEFWALIALLNWEEQGDDDAVLAPLIQALAQLPESKIYLFQERLAEQLHRLDARRFAEQYPNYPDAFSVDGFLYDRLCVVANGRAAYEAVLADPSLMPTELSFEPLLYAADQAYLLKTGKKMGYVPTVSAEEIETTYIEAHRKKHGAKPRGNRK